MANNINGFWIIVLIAVLFFASNGQNVETQPSDNNVNLADIVNPSVTFHGQRMFLSGTSLTTESVRILKSNGEDKDLGYKSLNSGTLSLEPNKDYKLLFFMNDSAPSSLYYVDVMDYTAKEKDSTEDLTGQGCRIDSTPTFTSYNTNYQPQTATAYAQSVSANSEADVSVRIAVSSDECYGMPDAKDKGYSNALCFAYNANAFDDVETNTGMVSIPFSVSSAAAGKAVSCYKMPILSDMEEFNVVVHLDAGATEPTNAHNITVYAEDIAFDLNADNLQEMWSYSDEDNNNLGSSLVTLGTIYIS